MRMRHRAQVRHWVGALVTSCFFFGAPAIAETMTLTPVVYAGAEDNNADGTFDTLLPDGILYVSSFPTFQHRTIFEFQLPPELFKPEVNIQHARLVIPVLGTSPPPHGSGSLQLARGEADETLTLEDFQAPAGLLSRPLEVDYDGRHSFDVSDYVRTFALDHPGVDQMRLLASTDAASYYAYWHPQVTLEIEYTAPPELPTLSVISPTQGSQHWVGEDIYLQASASDWHDGNLDAAIQWSLIDGDRTEPLGTGNDLRVSLPDGLYNIEASVADSDGNVVREHREIDVATPGNSRPWIEVDWPPQTIEGRSMTLSAWAYDVEDGGLEESVVWTNAQGALLAQGATLTITLPVGAHEIFAEVTDSGGLRAVQHRTVEVVPPPPYCTVGTLATEDWITAISVNGKGKASESNGGYADFSGTEFPVTRGRNQIGLATRGDNRVMKYWRVWIDLNQDRVFTTDEAVLTVNSLYSASYPFTIPASATAGRTRMRVGVSRGGTPQPCGIGVTGEFEDYSVLIPPP